jgi:hypothetical protein
MNNIIIVYIAKGIDIAINAKNGISSGTLDAKTKAITFLRLSKTTRPYIIPYTIELKSSVRRVI